jgi:hypothetical protein
LTSWIISEKFLQTQLPLMVFLVMQLPKGRLAKLQMMALSKEV